MPSPSGEPDLDQRRLDRQGVHHRPAGLELEPVAGGGHLTPPIVLPVGALKSEMKRVQRLDPEFTQKTLVLLADRGYNGLYREARGATPAYRTPDSLDRQAPNWFDRWRACPRLYMTTDSPHIQSLSATISAALESDRIGHPVFVRWMERVDGNPGSALDKALEMVSGWFGGEPASSHRPGGSDLQASVLARWPGGESALLIAAPVGFMDAPGLDIAVFGARGAIYHRV